MDWLPLFFSPVIAVLGTLGGVALTQRAAAKQARAEREAAAAREMGARLRDSTLTVAKLFSDEWDAVDSFKRDEADPDIERQMEIIDKKIEERFHGPGTSSLKLAIVLVPDREAREQLLDVMRAYAQSLSVEGGLAGMHSSIVTTSILLVGQQISAAYARGEKPDEYEMKQFRKFTQWPPGRPPKPTTPTQGG